ncbi:hypothetical protein SEA_TOMAS_171 [Streptomyces phage Tomas]|uniref:Uncharacterized protein n=1 Tax=Streptomyces phage Tomas TaxID=2914443 RepID=A0AA49BV13_9CAUD|nr:hypothetical protein PP453_gp138 [Streptomyces phage Tomas]UMO76329.1 hypothetical protein SEA_TOMAS_171 [Streptomyces phage Tomas]
MADKYKVKQHIETVYEKEKVQERISALQRLADNRKSGGKIISEYKQTGKQHQWLLYFVK